MPIFALPGRSFARKLGLLFCLCIGVGFGPIMEALAQSAGITLGKTELSPGQTFTITLTLPEDFTTAPTFPEIKGLTRVGTSSGSSTTIVNGQVSSTYSITQRYLAQTEGKYTLPAFTVSANGKNYKQVGATILVKKGLGEDGDPSSAYDPLEDFFGRRRADIYKSVKEDAFLDLDSDKDQVYVGEGFTLTLSLFVAEANRADMDFYDLTTQINEIVRKVKPSNCWEESFGITNVEPKPVTINGKRYTEYRIWQSAFYPLAAKPITIPKVSLKLIKYEMAVDPFMGGLDRQQTFTTLHSKPQQVAVQEVPLSPYGRILPVGDFKLEEHIGRGKVRTGESVSYQFIVKGEGNIAAVDFPIPQATDRLDIYPPSVQQNILRQDGRVTGTKTYTFLLQPKEAGPYVLLKHGFAFPFFNPKTGSYDSLTSRITLNSEGVALQEKSTQDEADYLPNTLIYLDQTEGLKVVGNMVLLALALATGIGMVWKGRKRS